MTEWLGASDIFNSVESLTSNQSVRSCQLDLMKPFGWEVTCLEELQESPIATEQFSLYGKAGAMLPYA